jgi:hypothetical protein
VGWRLQRRIGCRHGEGGGGGGEGALSKACCLLGCLLPLLQHGRYHALVGSCC